MFTSCRLILVQNQGKSNEKHLTVSLYAPTAQVPSYIQSLHRTHRVPTSLADWGPNGALDWSLAKEPGYLWQGKWRNVHNSVTNRADDSYSIGSSAHPQYKIWRYSLPERFLYFTEVMPLTSGYEELHVDVQDTVFLRQAVMSQNGFAPAGGAAAVGTGHVSADSHLRLLVVGELVWERLVN